MVSSATQKGVQLYTAEHDILHRRKWIINKQQLFKDILN
jgi:hypothetical protein